MKRLISAALFASMTLVLSQANAAPRGNNASKNASTAADKTSARPYEALIQKLANKHNVPVDLAHAIVRTESNYDADARGSAGEVGLMQIKPMTAKGLGYSGSIKQLYEPATNLEYGMKYLAQAHKLSGGDTCKTILKYNAGHGAKKMNPISARYCTKVKIYLASVQ